MDFISSVVLLLLLLLLQHSCLLAGPSRFNECGVNAVSMHKRFVAVSNRRCPAEAMRAFTQHAILEASSLQSSMLGDGFHFFSSAAAAAVALVSLSKYKAFQ